MFKINKYGKWYQSIIEKARLANRRRLPKKHPEYQYLERHHIIPKACGGTDDPCNLVLLTPKEHFICHLLLTKMCMNDAHTERMLYALKMIMGDRMTSSTSMMYVRIRLQVAENLRRLHAGKPKTEEQIRKMVATRRSKNNYLHSDVTKSKIGEKSKGRLQTSESRKKRSESMKGKSHASRFWINNGSEQKRVDATELASAMADGWNRGRLDCSTKGKTPIHKMDPHGKKLIKYVDDAADYLITGWMPGTGPKTDVTKKRLSISNKGKIKSNEHRKKLSQAIKQVWLERRQSPL